MNERTKDFIFYGIMFAYVALSIMVIVKEAKATPPHNVQIEDHTKTVIKRTPYNVEICSEVQRDKTNDTILGAIIGGILGNQNSTINGKEMRCRNMTRYKESMETIYSHSTITFRSNGKDYTVRFNK